MTSRLVFSAIVALGATLMSGFATTARAQSPYWRAYPGYGYAQVAPHAYFYGRVAYPGYTVPRRVYRQVVRYGYPPAPVVRTYPYAYAYAYAYPHVWPYYGYGPVAPRYAYPHAPPPHWNAPSSPSPWTSPATEPSPPPPPEPGPASSSASTPELIPAPPGE